MRFKYFSLLAILLFGFLPQTFYGQLSKWIVGNSQQTSGGAFYSLTAGNLKFYEVDFNGPVPLVSARNLGSSVNSISSMGSQDVINNALDSNGNILFYLFSASRTAYNDFAGSVSDTVYFVAPNSSTGLDEVFGKVAAVNRISSVIEHGFCPRPNFPGQYYFIYKTRYGSNSNDDVKYVIVDGINKLVSAPVTLISNDRIGEGFAVSQSNCSNDKHWLFTTKLESNGFITVRRSEINSTGIANTVNVYTINLTNNAGAGVVTALEMSSQGDRLAVCLFSSSSSNKAVSIFDFNVNTGLLSNERYYTNSAGGIVTCEFSPDGSNLYLMQGGSSFFPNAVYVCPVIAGGSYNVSNSNLLSSISINGSLAMELAFDGKIYVNKGHNQSSYFCITNPNSITPNVISTASPFLGTTTYRIGDAFPDQIDGEFTANSFNITIDTDSDTICEGQSSLLYAAGASDYTWSGGGVSSINDSVLVTPNITTTYYLLASNGSCQVTDSLTIYVNPNPLATISGNTNICSGESTTLIGAGGNSYVWTGGLTSAQSTITVTPSQTTSYFLQVSNGNCVDSDTIQVIVNPLPTITASPDQTICLGQSVTISASGGITFSWTGGVTASTSSITVSPLTSTYYYIEVSNATCSVFDTVLVNVDAMLTPLINGPASICSGQNLVLTASGGSNYIWSGGITSSSSVVNDTPVVDTYYYLSTANSCGTYFDSLFVDVIPAPQALIVGDSSICPGETVILMGTGGGNYYWNGSAIAGNDSLLVSPLSSSTYTLIVEDSLCSSLPFSFTVNVLGGPSVSIVGQDSICMGQSAVYSAQVTSGQSPFTYSWSNGGNTVSTNFTPAVTSTLTIIVSDQNGCSDTASLSIYPINYPDAFFAGEISGCAPLNAAFTNFSTGATSYSWNFGDGNNSSSVNPVNTYFTQGSYNVTLIAYNSIGCADTMTLNSYVTVLDSPLADIAVQSLNSTELNNYMISNQMLNADSCILYFGDGQLLQGCNWQSVIHNYPIDGEYTIVQIVTNSVGCSDTAEVVIEVESESTFYAPNAFTPGQNGKNDRFNVYGVGLDEFKMMIFDRWGELIFETTDIYEGWDGTYKGTPVELGVYVWKVDFIDKKLGNQYRIGHVTVVR